MLPPGPRGFRDVLRAFRAFTRDPDGQMLALSEAYGSVVSLRIGKDLVVVVSDPELVGELLLDKEGACIKDSVTRSLTQVLGKGLLTSEGDLWKRQRRLIAPSLGKKQIASYADAMVRHAELFARGLADGERRDLHDDMSAVTLAIVVETLFGSELGGGHANVGLVVDQYMEDFHALVHSWRRLFPDWFPFPERRRGARAVAELDDLVLGIVKAKRASGALGDDLLSRLLVARDESESERGMSDQQLRDEVVTLFMAGHETTANALAWALLLLAEHPEVDQRVAREAEEVLGDRAARAEDLGALPVTRAVIDETMRLYPPAHIIGREPVRELRLGRYAIPPGANVVVSPWAMHHDRRFFADPEAFRPDRWLDGSTEGLPRYAYLPFGGGPRICVGNHFAIMEAVLVLATIVRRARFERVSRAPVPAQPAITLRPAEGVPLRVALRPRTGRPPEPRPDA